MTKKDMFKISVSNLKRRKSRTFLTVLGIIIGAFSIILMIGIGLGMDKSISSMIDDMGSLTVLEVTKDTNTLTQRSKEVDNKIIRRGDIYEVSQIEGVELASPVIETSLRVLSGKYATNITVVGLEPSAMESFGFEIDKGELLDSNSKYQFVFGPRTISRFKSQRENDKSFGVAVDVLNEKLKVTRDLKYSPQGNKEDTTDANVYNIKGVGILDDGDFFRSSKAYTDIDSLKDMVDDFSFLNGEDIESGYKKLYVKVESNEGVNGVVETLEGMGYDVQSSLDMVDTLSQTSKLVQLAFIGIGSISLIVAAIGITNTMVMAINERKREIGIMKVVGASLKDIKGMFLIEAGLIGFLGGLMGVILSLLVSWAVNFVISSPGGTPGGGGRGISMLAGDFSIIVPEWLVLSAMIFSAMIGIIAGYTPAKKAMKSSALAAMRD